MQSGHPRTIEPQETKDGSLVLVNSAFLPLFTVHLTALRVLIEFCQKLRRNSHQRASSDHSLYPGPTGTWLPPKPFCAFLVSPYYTLTVPRPKNVQKVKKWCHRQQNRRNLRLNSKMWNCSPSLRVVKNSTILRLLLAPPSPQQRDHIIEEVRASLQLVQCTVSVPSVWF